jgi:hypothetical protein
MGICAVNKQTALKLSAGYVNAILNENKRHCRLNYRRRVLTQKKADDIQNKPSEIKKTNMSTHFLIAVFMYMCYRALCSSFANVSDYFAAEGNWVSSSAVHQSHTSHKR